MPGNQILLCCMPPNLGVRFHRVLKTTQRPIASPEPQSRGTFATRRFTAVVLEALSHRRAAVITQGKAGEGGEEPAIRSLFSSRLRTLRDPCEDWPVAPVTRCSPPTLESIRRPSRETRKIKYSLSIRKPLRNSTWNQKV